MFTGSCWLSMRALLLALEIDVALHPGAEMVRVARNVVFALAGLDAAQAADAFRGIDAERPAVLGPVVIRGRERGAGRQRRPLFAATLGMAPRAAARGRGAGAGRGAAELARGTRAARASAEFGFSFHGFAFPYVVA